MQPDTERRKDSLGRIHIAVPVELAQGDFEDSFAGDTVNLSTGGLSMRSACLPDVGSELVCRFHTLPAGAELVVAGEVVWSRLGEDGAGEFGIAFLNLDPTTQVLIEELIAEHDRLPPSEPSGVHRPMALATLDLEGGGAISGRVVPGGNTRLVTFEQDLDLLKLGAAVKATAEGEDAREGSIKAVEIKLVGNIPMLSVTVDLSNEEPIFGEFEWSLFGEVPAPDDTTPDLPSPEFSLDEHPDPSHSTLTEFAAPQLPEPASAPGVKRPDALQPELSPDPLQADEWYGYDEDVEPAGYADDRVEPDDWGTHADEPSEVAPALQWTDAETLFADGPATTDPALNQQFEEPGPVVTYPSEVGEMSTVVADDESAAMISAPVISDPAADAGVAADTASEDTTYAEEDIDGAPESPRVMLGSADLTGVSDQVRRGIAAARRKLWVFLARLFTAGGPRLQSWIAGIVSWAIRFRATRVMPVGVAAKRALASRFARRRRRTTSAPASTNRRTPARGSRSSRIVVPVLVAAMGFGAVGLAVYAFGPWGGVPATQQRSADKNQPTKKKAKKKQKKLARLESMEQSATEAQSVNPYAAAVTTQAVAPQTAAAGPVFGSEEVPNARRFTLRMSSAVRSLKGIPDKGGFTVIIPGALSLDRAGPIGTAHGRVTRSMILNKGDRSELTIRFKDGDKPIYRVTGKGSALEILIES